MKRLPIWAVALVVAAAVMTVPRFDGELGTIGGAEAQTPAPAPPAIPVTAGIVAVADVPVILNAIGTVQAYNTVTIKSRVDGHIMQVAFTEGQSVTAGTPLIRIDPRPYQMALEQAQAARERNEAALINAQADLGRSSQLVGSGFRTAQVYDQQKMQVTQAQALLKADEALINMAQLNLGYTDIRAPIDGRLGAKLVDAGNLVRATDNTALVTINQVQPIFVSFTVAQSNLEQIRAEQAKGPLVARAVGSDAKQVLAEGRLTLIDNAIEQATGTIRLKATFANENERLWPGQFVNVRLILTTRNGVATVPAQTVQNGPTGRYVYVIKADDTVERRPVEIAAEQDGIVVVTKGLAGGDRVVVEGQYRLTNGAKVKATGPQPAAAG